jgi:DNA excision repair protein ERCC-4
MNQNNINITVDDRERNCGVIEALRDFEEVILDVRRIPVGDYVVDKKIVIERKSLRDFVLSIMQGRLFRQAMALKKSGMHPILILEGTTKNIASFGLKRESIQGAIITVSVIMGIPLLRSKDSGETAKLIIMTSKQVNRSDSRGISRGGCRPKDRRGMQLFILQSLPHVGPVKAAQLIERFGSIEAVMEANSEELASIYGIGEKSASDIRNILREDYDDYL